VYDRYCKAVVLIYAVLEIMPKRDLGDLLLNY